jgi:3-vinyl bacteriochlorophyllide hydratase
MPLFTEEQLELRQASPWTKVVMAIAVVQFLAYIVGFYLVIRFLVVGDLYVAATISVWVKIALMWAVTITGMFWEREIFGVWFMHPQFYWEDLGNLVAMITHNAYFVVLLLGFEPRSIMWVMLVAYVTYLFNFVQWVIVGVRSYRQRRQRAGRPRHTATQEVS